MKKRGHREGTIYRRPNGTWCAQVMLPDGKRLSKYAKTQRECREWIAETLKRNRSSSSSTVQAGGLFMLTARRCGLPQ